MLRLVFILLLGILASCSTVPPYESLGLKPPLREVPIEEQIMNLDKQHSTLCEHVFDDFKNKVKIGMTSQQFAEALNTKWVDKADVDAITLLLGWIPLEIDSTSICYSVALYPNEDKWSNYVLYFRLSKPPDATLQEYTNIGKKFVRGSLQAPSVVLKEYALCYPGKMKTFEEVGVIERFPEKAESR